MCIYTKYIFFSPSNFIALTLAVWRWHDLKNFNWMIKSGAQIFLTRTYHYQYVHDLKCLSANFQALFQKSRVLSSTTWTKCPSEGGEAEKEWNGERMKRRKNETEKEWNRASQSNGNCFPGPGSKRTRLLKCVTVIKWIHHLKLNRSGLSRGIYRFNFLRWPVHIALMDDFSVIKRHQCATEAGGAFWMCHLLYVVARYTDICQHS